MIRLVGMFARERNLGISKPEDRSTLVRTLVDAVSNASQKEILVHGTRIEAMFSHVAGALGYCEVIKQEDAGDLYCARSDIAVPDFRVLTLEGDEFLVEVKNRHKAHINDRYRMKREYLAKLCNYAEVFDRKLKFAIYWSRPGLWSMVSPKALESDGQYYSISMAQSMKRNEMKVLGDSMVGVVPPATLTVIANPSQPRKVGMDGRAAFTIGDVKLTCGGREVRDPIERKLAWFLFLHGD